MRKLLLLVAMVAPAGIGIAQDWVSAFPVDRKTLGIRGSNEYFPLTPGSRWSYQHGNETEVVTVLSETQIIDEVECRVVEDREEKNGQLIELTHDYFALDPATNDVYYMGEDVNVYKNGKVVSHEGAWKSGVNGAKFGMMLPGRPKTGQRFYQELAPPSSMDRIEIKSTSATVKTPSGTFENCILVEETNPAEKGAKDSKWYARGVGPARDSGMLLVSYTTK